MAQNNTGPVSPSATVAPAQPSSKSSTAAPKLNNEMEMGSLPTDAAPVDIMQIARVGDIAAMEKLFESKEFDATYTDEEGITPLHVRFVHQIDY
jgi:hypothetical protein